MSGYNILVFILFTGLVTTGVASLWRYKRVNPVFWFLLAHWVIGAATILIGDLDRREDLIYVVLFFTSTISFLVGAHFAFRTCRIDEIYQQFWSKPIEFETKSTRILVWIFVSISSVVTLVYFQVLGYNLVLETIKGEALNDISRMRLEAYAGDRYLAPGYVNQFRNVLLPLGLSVIGAAAWLRGRVRNVRLMAVISIPLLIVGLLGAGHRSFLVYAFGAFLFGLATIGRLLKRIVIPGAIVVIALFGAASFYLQRVTDFSVTSSVGSFIDRIFLAEAESALVGARYVINKDIVWFADWGQDLLGLLPGYRGSTLQNEVFAVIHGVMSGTGAVSTVISVYHNGGWFFVIIIYFMIAYIYTYLFARFLRKRRSLLRCFGYGALFFYLMTFITGPPVSLVNRGVVTLMIVLFLRKLGIFREEKKYTCWPIHHSGDGMASMLRPREVIHSEGAGYIESIEPRGYSGTTSR